MENTNKIDDFDFVDYFVPEKELIDSLLTSKTDNRINFNLFANLIRNPFVNEEYLKYVGFYIATSILREELGFDKNMKPGDFDVLIIPFSNDEIYFDRTCAIEVKVVRPTIENPKKAPNSYGITQLNGLIQDGFPFIGLIHICMTEPLKENEKAIIKFDLMPFDVDNPKNNKNFLQNTVDTKFDTFSWFSAENQMKRLISKEIPKYVGLCTIGLNITPEKELVAWYNCDFNSRFESGYFNPHKRKETIDRIETFWTNNKSRFIIVGN